MLKNEININFLFKNKYTKLIEFFISNPLNEYYVNEILNRIEISPQVLCNSLKELVDIGVLLSSKKANSIYYRLNNKNNVVETLKKIIKPLTYKDAGVDIDLANSAVNRIKKYVKQTYNSNVLSNVGSFGGLYRINQDNVLVSSTDGVGTKLKLAFLTNKHDTVGQDLVNHCVNDILVMGAKPLFFLDYIGCGKIYPEVIEGIVKGLSIACKENNCALIGGEIAEMPGLYKEKEYDLASFIVGTVKRKKIIDGSKVKRGDMVIGLSSSGLHTNGYSLAIKVLLENAKLGLRDKPKGLGCTPKEELMKVHISYLKPVSEILDKFEVKAMAHITGSGLVGNIPRILPNNLSVELNKKSWKINPIFSLIQKLGNINDDEMYKVFNMGIGFVIIVDKNIAKKILNILMKYSFKSQIIGRVINGDRKIIFND
ncbi:MAG: phosphoribosylformylglycinamidine cyclo-ligase [Nanoarchaeota archaeon]|nr:phosphoribosylformylglycinamidine cyclo-ligase [Nanoarchaeota archaeon]